jgi:hypothetical protein
LKVIYGGSHEALHYDTSELLARLPTTVESRYKLGDQFNNPLFVAEKPKSTPDYRWIFWTLLSLTAAALAWAADKLGREPILIYATAAPEAVKAVQASDIQAACYPVVTRGKTTLSYALTQTSDVQISVTSTDGRVISRFEKKSLAADNYQQEVDLTAAPAGLYLCSVATRSGNKVIKVLKQ